MRFDSRPFVAVLVSALAFASAVMVPSAAQAGDGRVTVELKDGTSVRGEIVEKVPGKKVVVQLATGEVRSFEWGNIARMDESSAAPSSQTSDAKEAKEANAPDDGGVVVHLNADDPRATLQRRIGTSAIVVTASNGTTATGVGEAWEDVCVMPCDKKIALHQTVRVAGDGVTPSSNFVLQRDVSLDAKTGSLGLRRGGVWVLTLGLTAVITGGVFLIVDASMPSHTGGSILSPGLMYGLLGGGALATGGGIAMVAASGTNVRDDQGATIARARPPSRAIMIPAAFSF